MTANDYRHELLRKNLKGSLREYARGIRPKASLEWAVGETEYVIKSGLSVDEAKGILVMVELETSDAERRRRLAHLREHLHF
jgi:hypothetical protein